MKEDFYLVPECAKCNDWNDGSNPNMNEGCNGDLSTCAPFNGLSVSADGPDKSDNNEFPSNEPNTTNQEAI